MGQDEGGGGGFVVCGGVGVGGVGGCGGLVVGECAFTAAGCGQDWRRAENQLHLVAGASSFLVFAQQSSKQMSSLLFVDFLICLVFVSSVRSSSGYHGLIEIRSSSSANPLFQIFQILQIRK